MKQVSGTFEDGTVILNESVNWANGSQVVVAAFDTQETTYSGKPWPRTDEERRAWVEALDELEPVMSNEEYDAWSRRLEAERASQKEFSDDEDKRIARLFD